MHKLAIIQKKWKTQRSYYYPRRYHTRFTSTRGCRKEAYKYFYETNCSIQQNSMNQKPYASRQRDI